jgi:hypothetical protein
VTATLAELASTATNLASLAWRAGSENVDFGEHQTQVERDAGLPELDLAAARQIIDEARRLHPDDRSGSDAWLAPRLHAALRLSRREAASRGLWRHLGMVVFPDYVRWRFGPGSSSTNKDEPPTPERFHGDPSKHSLGRLWWGAEQFRNGPDYAPVELAFSNQDLMNNLFRMDIGHHRPTCQAAVQVLFPPDGQPLSGDIANALSKAANLTATTLLIDALAPDEPLDAAARRVWMQTPIDPNVIIQRLPDGPEDPQAPAGSTAAMVQLFTRLVTFATLRPSRQRGPERTSTQAQM